LYLEVEDLTKINNHLKIKYIISKKRYLDRLKEKNEGVDDEFLISLEKEYLTLMNNIKESTDKLKVRLFSGLFGY